VSHSRHRIAVERMKHLLNRFSFTFLTTSVFMHFKQPSSLKLIARAVALAIASTAVSCAIAQTTTADEAQPRPKDDAVRLGGITIVGQGDKLGAGQILNEDAVKSRSTVTKAATEKDRATGNPYQAISLLPGINTYNHDATGLFGGGLTMRGFGADQIGFTINGVPVNDSGNFAVFPQEYVDQENVCTQSVTQGSSDFEAPHVGATGGSVGIISCDPEEKRRFRIAQTIGELSLTRTYLRVDSGRFADNKAKAFLSYSHSQADKWKGAGVAKRDHVDVAFSLDISPDSRILGSAMYNRAVNNNFLTLSLADLAAKGYNYDFLTTFTPSVPSPAYYKLATNPFENLIASLSGSFKLAENLQMKVQPYLWYGYGTGGTQQRALLETAFLNTATGKIGAGVDLNGDGDTADTVIVANSSVTKTTRPGITAELNYQLGNHALKAGLWYERAEHRQTGPAVPVNSSGESTDIWLRDGHIRRPDGSDYQSRDWKTISPAFQLYASDAWSFMNDRGLLQLGLRTPEIKRQFTNFANEGNNSQTTFSFTKRYSEVLPQAGVRFNLDREQQVFVNVGKNFRAPPNFAFAPTNNNIKLVNGVAILEGAIDAETSITTDLGYRYQGKLLTLSASAFNVDFKNRQSNAYNSALDRSIYTNAGDVNNRGLELEVGTLPMAGFTAYASFTTQKSKVKNDLPVGKGLPPLPTKGKQFTLTPEVLAGLSLQYASGPLYARVKVKHVGKQFATLMNDEEVPSYTTADFDAGYRFADLTFLRNPMIRLNVSNIGDTKYRNPSSGSVVNAKAIGSTTAGTVFYYLGAPRLVSVTLSADF
jgi:iron complex outermembrane recepter protein